MSVLNVNTIQPVGSSSTVTINALVNSDTSLSFGVNSDEKVRIDSDGDVGIGTDNPKQKLDVHGNIYVRQPAGTEAKIQINEATTNNAFNIKQTATEALIQTTANQPFNIRAQGGSGSTSYLSFWTRDNERLTITSGGNIGIGTISPDAMLHLSGTSPFIRFTDTVDSSHYAHIGHSDSSIFVIDADAANAHAGSAIQFKVDNTERLRILNDGDVSIINGNLIVADTHGIDFSASEGGTGTSSEASILDDYETGTFTPGITFGNNNNDLVLGSALGSYTKIGRRIFIDITINMSDKGDSTGMARITGLPFTCASAAVMRVHGYFSYYANMQSLTGRPICYNGNGATTAALYDDGTSTQPSLNDTNFADNSSFRGTIQYTCA